MLKKEFDQLIGRESTEEEYTQANAMYMDAGNMDKQEFCKEYKKHKDSQLIALFWNQYNNERTKNSLERDNRIKLQRETIAKLKDKNEDLQDRLDEQTDLNAVLTRNIGTFLIDQYIQTGLDLFRDKAAEILGMKRYLRLLLERDMPLRKEDCQLIVDTIGRDALIETLSDY